MPNDAPLPPVPASWASASQESGVEQQGGVEAVSVAEPFAPLKPWAKEDQVSVASSAGEETTEKIDGSEAMGYKAIEATLEKLLCTSLDNEEKVDEFLEKCAKSTIAPASDDNLSDAGSASGKASIYERALREGNVKADNSLGKEFSRAHAAGTAAGDQYRGCVGIEAKKKFRLQWAEARYKETVLTRTQTTSFTRVDSTRGVYRSFARIVVEEGGDAAARKAALLLCSRAARLGGDWVRYNALTSRYDYLYLEHQWQEDFTKAWSLYQREVESQTREEKEEPPNLPSSCAKIDDAVATPSKKKKGSPKQAEKAPTKNKKRLSMPPSQMPRRCGRGTWTPFRPRQP